MVFGQMNEPPGARMRVALTGLTIAEYFRDVEGQDVLLLFKKQTRGKSDNECYHYHPNSRTSHCFFPFHRLCDVNTYKEDGRAAPKYL